MRNGKAGDKASLGLVLASDKGGLDGRSIVGKAKLNGLLRQIMQSILARCGGIPNRYLIGRYKSHGKHSLQHGPDRGLDTLGVQTVLVQQINRRARTRRTHRARQRGA